MFIRAPGFILKNCVGECSYNSFIRLYVPVSFAFFPFHMLDCHCIACSQTEDLFQTYDDFADFVAVFWLL